MEAVQHNDRQGDDHDDDYKIEAYVAADSDDDDANGACEPIIPPWLSMGKTYTIGRRRGTREEITNIMELCYASHTLPSVLSLLVIDYYCDERLVVIRNHRVVSLDLSQLPHNEQQTTA